MKKSDISRLRELVGLCEGHRCYEARLLAPTRRMPADPDPHWADCPFRFDWDEVPFLELQWGLEAHLDNGRTVFWSETPWIVEDWPGLRWEGNYFFHRTYPEVATIIGITAKHLKQALEHHRKLRESKEILTFPGIMGLLPFNPIYPVYLVEGTTKDFGGPIYLPRLRAFKKMVRWAMPEAEAGFTVLHTISKHWGYMLVSPWLIKSTDPVWLRRLKMFQALNSYDPTCWPMSLLIEKWSDFREIRF